MNEVQLVRPGTAVDRYTVEGVVGRGGMAVVYRVRHSQLGTLHALKLLQVPSEGIRKRLLREGRVQAQLRHPNIVTVTDVVDVAGAPGLVMELIRGPALDRLLADHQLDLDQLDTLAQGIIRGVAAAHAHGLIHRDLKPANIMLAVTDDGLVPKITDFGLAKVLEGDTGGPAAIQTRSGMAMGTPAYMAPEQIRSAKAVDHRADIFALGCILYEMATGKRTFDGDDLLDIFTSVAAGQYVPSHDLAPHLPDRMHDAILGALAVDRDQRLPSCAALLAVWRGEGPASVDGGPFDMDVLKQRYRVEDIAVVPDGADPTARQGGLRSTFSGSVLEEDGPVSTMDHALDGDIRAALSLTSTRGTADAPVAASTAPPGTAVARSAGQSPARSLAWTAGLGAVGLASVSGLVVGGLVLAAGLGFALLPLHEWTLVGADKPDGVEDVVEDRDDPPTPAPTPRDPVPVEDAVAAHAFMTAPRPSAPAPSPTAAARRPVAAPADLLPVVEPTAAPESVPAPGLAPNSPAVQVEVAGDAKLVELTSSAGALVVPGSVPPGTYRIRVTFDGLPPQLFGEVVVDGGAPTTITCHRSLRSCR